MFINGVFPSIVYVGLLFDCCLEHGRTHGPLSVFWMYIATLLSVSCVLVREVMSARDGACLETKSLSQVFSGEQPLQTTDTQQKCHNWKQQHRKMEKMETEQRVAVRGQQDSRITRLVRGQDAEETRMMAPQAANKA